MQTDLCRSRSRHLFKTVVSGSIKERQKHAGYTSSFRMFTMKVCVTRRDCVSCSCYFQFDYICFSEVLNPWHWDEPMRKQALDQCHFEPSHKVVDVGAGTGFTSEGVCGYLKEGNCGEQLTMLDQSTAQLAQAKKKKILQASSSCISLIIYRKWRDCLCRGWGSTATAHTTCFTPMFVCLCMIVCLYHAGC